LKGSYVHTIQKMIAAGGVKRIRNNGPSVLRTNWTKWLSLPLAHVVSSPEADVPDKAEFGGFIFDKSQGR
jgi:hypothetical protein